MNKMLQGLLGLNLASFERGLRMGPFELGSAAVRSFRATQAFENPKVHRLLRKIPPVNLGEILGKRAPTIQITARQYEMGMLPSEEAFALIAILVAEDPKTVLEIGTFMGHTTEAIAENLLNGIVHTVDLPEGFSSEPSPTSSLPKDDFHLISQRIVGREYKGKPYEKRIVQHFADTATWDFREAGSPTFFFIDGSHTYEYCRNDSEKCFSLCRGNGAFLWHDCDIAHPGVVKLLSEWKNKGRNVVRIRGSSLAYWRGT